MTNKKQTIIILEKTFQDGFGVMPFSILRNGKIPIQEKLLYLNLLSYAWNNAQCFPGQTRIARDFGVGERTIRRYLNNLRKLGLIDWKIRGLNKTNVYYINEIPENLRLSEAERTYGAYPERTYGADKVDKVEVDEVFPSEKRNSSNQDRLGDSVDVGMVDKPNKVDSHRRTGTTNNKPDFLLAVPAQTVADLAEKYQFAPEEVTSKAEDCHNFYKSKGLLKTFKDQLALLSNWLKKASEKRAKEKAENEMGSGYTNYKDYVKKYGPLSN